MSDALTDLMADLRATPTERLVSQARHAAAAHVTHFALVRRVCRGFNFLFLTTFVALTTLAVVLHMNGAAGEPFLWVAATLLSVVWMVLGIGSIPGMAALLIRQWEERASEWAALSDHMPMLDDEARRDEFERLLSSHLCLESMSRAIESGWLRHPWGFLHTRLGPLRPDHPKRWFR